MKWVFKVKNNNRHRARLVAQGFSQIPGVDYFESHSPVMSEVTFRTLLLLSLQKGWDIVAIDIEKAFLEAKLDENIYIKPPPGLDLVENIDTTNKICKLNKAVYGLVQASKAFYREIVTQLKNKNLFTVSSIEPCLIQKWIGNEQIVGGIYVDDIIFIGNKHIIENEINTLKERYSLRLKTKVDEYVGCQLIIESNSIILHQQRLIDKMESEFSDRLKNISDKKGHR